MQSKSLHDRQQEVVAAIRRKHGSMIWRAGLAPLRPDRPLGMVQRDLSDSRGKAAAEYLHANPGKNTTQVCMKFGITKPTLYAWWKRLYPDVLIGKRAAVSP